MAGFHDSYERSKNLVRSHLHGTSNSYSYFGSEPQMMDIAEMAILVGGAREGQSFVLKYNI
jgi:hypothetical protein